MNSLFKTLVLGLFITATFIQCTETDEFSYLPQDSSNIFIDLVKSDVSPFNKLSKEAILEFNATAIFDEKGEFLGADHTKAAKELSEAEVQSLFNQIFGQEVTILDEMPEETHAESQVELRGNRIFILRGFRPLFSGPDGDLFCRSGFGVCRICVNDNEQ